MDDVTAVPHDCDSALNAPIVLPNSAEMRGRYEVFAPDEAARLCYGYGYYKTGDIPAGCALGPEQDFTHG